MSEITDAYVAARERFKTSVKLQYDATVNPANTSNKIILGLKGGYRDNLLAFETNLRKTVGAKTPLKNMIFELDIFNPPPAIALYINPEAFDIKFSPRFAESRVRQTNPNDSGFIVQFHHDELDMISSSGRSAMFYSEAGLTTYDRRNTEAYANIQQLIATYRNNGTNINRKPGKYSMIESVGRVMLTYNDITYRGNFESFTVSESDDKPFNLEYSFEYKVTKQIDTTGMSSDILRNLSSKQTFGIDVL